MANIAAIGGVKRYGHFSIPIPLHRSVICRYTMCSDRSFSLSSPKCVSVYACVHVNVREEGLAWQERQCTAYLTALRGDWLSNHGKELFLRGEQKHEDIEVHFHSTALALSLPHSYATLLLTLFLSQSLFQISTGAWGYTVRQLQ